jgi:integrase
VLCSKKIIRIYLLACSQPLQDVATLMLETGLRPSEIFQLKKSNVNLQQGYIQIFAGKTKSAQRRIPISETAREILKDRSEKSPNEFLFAGGKQGKGEKPVIKLTNAHKGAVERAKLKPFRLYDLRHTFATRVCEAGIDLVTVKDLLGHSRLEMILRYSHPTEKHRIDAIRKIEAYRKAS